MAHNTQLNSGTGGDLAVTVDLSLNTYPTTGKLPASCLYVSANDTTAPTPVTDGHPLPVTGTLTVDLGANNDVTVTNATATNLKAEVVGTGTFAVQVTSAPTTAVTGPLTDVELRATAVPVSLASVPSHAVTNAGTFAVQLNGDGLTALQLIDDAIYTDDVPFTAGSNKVMAAGFRFDDAAPDGVTEGDVGYARMSSRRELYVTLRDAAGNERGLNVDASGQVAVTNAGTFAVQAAQSGTWNVGTVTTVTTCSTVTTVTTVSTVTTLTGSAIAHASADSGNPHKIGAKATTSLNAATPVADADRTDLKASVDGALYTRSIALEDIVTATPVAITDGSSTSVIAAQGAGVKVYLTEVIIANTSSSNVTVDLRDGTAGAVKATFPVPANGGVVKTLHTPLAFSANTAIAADPSAAASTITVTLIGFKSKV